MKDYIAFFETEDEAINHCREMNKGRSSKDPDCVAVVDGPGGEFDPEWFPDAGQITARDTFEANYAVVDLEQAKELLDFCEAGSPTCLIVTD